MAVSTASILIRLANAPAMAIATWRLTLSTLILLPFFLKNNGVKKILHIPVPEGYMATNPDDARAAAEKLGTLPVVVKAQIHAGGRGKGGGVKVARTLDDARSTAAAILGKPLVTPQTGPQGKKVGKVLVEQGLDIAQELYLGITLDREIGKPVLMASKFGGMEIEEVAHRDPTAILKEPFDAIAGLQPFQARKVAYALGLAGETHKKAVPFLLALAKAYVETDCSLAEINPLMITGSGDVVALGAKMNFDDNALISA